jgi:hypothetical protein
MVLWNGSPRPRVVGLIALKFMKFDCIKGERGFWPKPIKASTSSSRLRLCRAWLLSGLISLALTVGSYAAIPSNDSFLNGKLITGGLGTLSASNVDASKEEGEPAHAGNAGGKSVWYLWHCSSGGTVDFSVQDATFGYALAIYVEKTLESLTPIASGLNSSVSFQLAPGQVYRIAVDGIDGASGDFTLRWSQTLKPGGGPDLLVPERLVNLKIVEQIFTEDDRSVCEVEERCTVLGRRRLLRFDMHTFNLGTEDLVYGSPADSPLFQYAACHNHYHFEALATYRVLTVSNDLMRIGNKFGFCLEDVQNVAAPSGATRQFTCDLQGIQAGWSDIYAADLPCQYVDITGLPPGDYVLEIEVDPLHQIPESNDDNNLTRVPFTLTAPCSSRPANDDFVNAEQLSGSVVTVVNDNTCATRQTGEPKHLADAGSAASKSIWYYWVAPYSGPVIVSTEGSAFESVVAVYTGSTLAELNDNRVAEGGAISELNKQSRLSFEAVAQTKYYIAVDGFNLGSGSPGGVVVLSINPESPDEFANCLPLAGSDGRVTGNILNASMEDEEPAHGPANGGSSLWYCWTAPTSETFVWDTVGSSFDSFLSIYTGDSLGGLVRVNQDDDSGGAGTSRLSLQAIAGTTYHVAVDRRDGTNGYPTTGVLALNWHSSAYQQAPVIIEQPHSLATFMGTNETLSVSVAGTLPLTYQWYRSGIPILDDDHVSGATAASLTFTDIRESDRGMYEVRIQNQLGSVTSQIISVVVASRIRVLYVEPRTGTPGSIVPVTLSVAANGGEHSFRFSLSYDPLKLSNPVVLPGPDLPAAAVLESDTTKSTLGQIGIRATLPPGAVLNSRDAALIVVQFKLDGSIPAEQRVTLCPTDQPWAREILDVDGLPLPTKYACGVIVPDFQDILTGAFLPDGSFQLQLHGMPGVTYEFQSSTDLKTWVPLATEQNQSGQLIVTDTSPQAGDRRFYRTLRK